ALYPINGCACSMPCGVVETSTNVSAFSLPNRRTPLLRRDPCGPRDGATSSARCAAPSPGRRGAPSPGATSGATLTGWAGRGRCGWGGGGGREGGGGGGGGGG